MSNKKLNIIFNRNFGIKNGRGYQPINMYKSLKKDLANFYIFRIIDNKYKNNPIIKKLSLLSYPFLFLINIYLKFNKSANTFTINQIFFENYWSYFMSYKQDYYMLCNIFNKKLLENLKQKNKKKILYMGSLHPKYVKEKSVNEFKKLNLEFSLYQQKRLDYETSLVNEYDYLIVNSKYSANNWKQNGFKGKIFVSPLGVDNKYYSKKNNINKKENIFIYVGRISCLKGVHTLLEAWDELKLENSKLLIVGNKKLNEWSYFEDKINNSKNVEILGYSNDMPKIYEKSLALVFPSLMEGFGKVVTEAMSQGLPIIGTPCVQDSFRDKKDGFYIDYNNKEQIKKYIKYYYENSSIAIEMGKSAQKYSKKLSWDNYSKSLNQNIQKIMKNGK